MDDQRFGVPMDHLHGLIDVWQRYERQELGAGVTRCIEELIALMAEHTPSDGSRRPLPEFSEMRLAAMERDGWTPRDVRDLISAFRKLDLKLLDVTAERNAHRGEDGDDRSAERFYRELHVVAVALGVPLNVPSLDCGKLALEAAGKLRETVERLEQLIDGECQHCKLSETLAKLREHPHFPQVLDTLELDRERIITVYSREPYDIALEVLRG